MRGARGEAEVQGDKPADEPADEALRLLHEIRDEIAALRSAGRGA